MTELPAWDVMYVEEPTELPPGDERVGDYRLAREKSLNVVC